MSGQPREPREPGAAGPVSGPSATIPRERVYELLAHLVASAEICTVEPHYYGSFRLLDAASKVAAAMLGGGLDDSWLAAFQAELDERKLLMMHDRPAFYAYLPQASRQVAQRILETAVPNTQEAGS